MQKGLPLNLASEDPAIDSGLKAVSLLERHSLLAYNITPAACVEGSALLCNDYRHASAPARSESWGVVDVQVDFTGLAIIRPHHSSPRQGTAMYPEGQWSTDQSRSEVGAEHPCSRNELAQQLFKTEDLLRPGWARPRRPWLLGSQQRSRARDACRRPLGRLDRSDVRTAT